MTMTLFASLALRLRARLATFADDSRGSVTIEAVIMLPILIWAYCATFVYFDAYRQTAINEKATYTIADMFSRDTMPVNDAYLDGAYSMLNFLTRSNSDRKLRVSVIRYDADEDEYHLQWSKARGPVGPIADGSKNWRAILPTMSDEEILIYVETWTDYDAPFNVGLNDEVTAVKVFTRPRFAPQVLFDNNA
ncbi:TadE/TadG family type IV pilus assembly protein [Aquicoccus sp. G2-2]|uniref:TadE/TadG family type IV pilus assembly protein n=1 Tax=Aquicoccus sp. G2-2 TaxID=3092120 RepID=UPI002AE03E6C|nr:hypothetical protein [Aquicoccus sp. G2-2]MEA1113848.1 hypothetical protein [Aquicoccus sp. G2-2]